MPDTSIWKDKKQREAFIAKGRAAFDAIRDQLAGLEDAAVVGIEPESGDHFVGRTLGEANSAAAEKYIDQWIYFARLDDPEAAIPLPTW
jgi:hypothetical protein